MFYSLFLTFAALFCTSLALVPDIQTLEKRNNVSGINQSEVHTIQLYYESLCPHSRLFYKRQLLPVVRALGSHLNIHTNPYGNAATYEEDGEYDFSCQHGEDECYGNKLHACAVDLLQNVTQYIEFNACLVDLKRNFSSDDETADLCGKMLNIDSEPIKYCAKSEYSSLLLKTYGDEKNAAHIPGVPWALLDGKHVSLKHNLTDVVCKRFQVKPKPCEERARQQRQKHKKSLTSPSKKI